MPEKVVAIIQARVSSTRLPGKVLLDIQGQTVLEHIIKRVSHSKLIGQIVIATTIKKEDLAIVKLCADNGKTIYRGSENDVLDRFYQASMLFGAIHIVRITADCPLIDPGVIDEIITLHLKNSADFTSNTINETYPDGLDAEVFTFHALKKTWENAKLNSEREHVTIYMKKNPADFKLCSLEYSMNLSDKRWTLDEQRDYEFIKIIYQNLYQKDKLFDMSDILDFLQSHPEVEKINSGIIRNEGYLKSLSKDE